MRVLDLHCDTLTKLAEEENCELRKNSFSVDIEKLKKSNYIGQFFALFVDRDVHPNVHEWALKLIETFEKEEVKNSDLIRQARSYTDIIENDKNGLISCILTIEEGAVLEGKLENLKKFYDRGVRLITLTWNYPNEIGFPNSIVKCQNKGLTEFGFSVVDLMNEMGMLIDVSHLSDKGFQDVAMRSRSPFIASHSNARSIKNHPRNLTDEMIRVIGQRGGVTGLNFYSLFLGKTSTAKVEDMVRHVKHICNVGGIEVLALGSDFDGIGTPVEFEDCSRMDVLYYGLLKSGFTEDEVDKIFYKNALRVIKDVLR